MSVNDLGEDTRNKENTMSQRCHEHIREVRRRIAAVVIHVVAGFVRTRAEIGHRMSAEQSRKEAGFVHRMEVDSGRKAPGSGRKGQEIVEADRRVQETVGAGRIGFGHTAVVVLEEVVEEVCCSLGREAGRMVSGMVEDIAKKTGRGSVAIGHREQEKNMRQCSAVLVQEAATGRASWQKVVAVGAGERRSPRRQDMLGSPTWFQGGLQS